MIRVIAIEDVDFYFIKCDEEYLINKDSLYGEFDGEWSADVYSVDEEYIGHLYLSHFRVKV